MKTALSLSFILFSGTLASGARAQQAKQKNIEAYLRHLYAFGPDVVLVVGTPRESPVEGLLETTINLTIGENKQTVKFYISRDGKYLFRGDLSDMTKDPLAESRAQIQMKDAPSLGE